MNIYESSKRWARQSQHRHWGKPVTTSTNSIAKDNLVEIEDFKLFLTSQQTQGRGRGINTWVTDSPTGHLLSTWCFRAQSPPQQFTAPLMGLGLYSAAKLQWPNLEWSLKAPNDLF